MKNFREHLLVILTFVMISFTMSCTEEDKKDEPTIDPPMSEIKMIIVNQGQFTKANASLSTISRYGEVNNDIFQSANNRPLGDVAQSMARIENNLYVVLNNSNKVEVINSITFKSEGTVLFDETMSPRYIIRQDDTSAIVSGGMGKLARINTKTFKTIEYVPVENGSIEQMFTVGKKIFCTIPYGNNAGIYVYNAGNLKTSKKIESSGIPYETSLFVEDKDKNIWTLSKTDKNVLVCIDPVTEQVTNTIAIPEDIELTYFPRLGMDFAGTTLFFNGNKDAGETEYVFAANISDKTVKTYVELTGLGMTFGMAVGEDGNIYICDCLDYSAQRGYIREYRPDGSYFSYRVGIYPGQVFFYY